MDLKNSNTNVLLIKNNYYRNNWKLINTSENTVIFYLKKLNIIIKIYKLIDEEKEIINTNNFLNLSIYKYSKYGYCNSFRELFLLNLMDNLIEKKICINYPRLITYKFLNKDCKQCNTLIKNKILKYSDINKSVKKYLELQLISNRLLLIFKEYIPFSILDFFYKSVSNKIWMIFFFQILYTLYINNKELELINFDIHIHNIYYKKIKSGGYIKYRIGNNTYKIPNIGYIFIIIDYGNSLSLKFKLSNNEKDIYNQLKKYHYDLKSFITIFNKQQIINNLLLKENYSKLISKFKKYDINYYNLIIKNSKKYIGKTNLNYDLFLKYFIIKHLSNYSKIEQILEKKIYYPNNNFIKIISKYQSFIKKKIYKKLNPEYIIETEFNMYKS